ncbi:Rrf2 family transcriptional regulator [Priestia endophytica]|uniref:Rrf2 family transcriptional regulator n=1 Tax=Priestia endophytica TaxID=135735 RepID=UPI003D28C110
MRLTQYTDYSLRVLIYLGLRDQHKLSNIKEIADSYNISKNHLMKVTHQLGQMGLIKTVRGRNGGISLNKAPQDINIGDVVAQTEEDFQIVECFQQNSCCAISSACKLKGVLREALKAFLAVLKQYTLEDLIQNEAELYFLLHTEKATKK